MSKNQYYHVAEMTKIELEKQLKMFEEMQSSYCDISDKDKDKLEMLFRDAYSAVKKAQMVFKKVTNGVYKE